MPVLSDADRAQCAQRVIEHYFGATGKVADLDNAEVRLMIDDIDTWLNSQQAEANQAIRQAIRDKASLDTKAAGIASVAEKRGGFF